MTEEEIRLRNKFFSKIVIVENGCWEFLGNKPHDVHGYRTFSGILVHRLMWEFIFGIIPEGLDVCHSCDNPPCVRPNHLFLGTHSDNMRDMRAKGRHHGKPNITHCKNGHPLATGNLIVRKNRPNHRECLTCHREQEKIRRDKLGATRK